MLNDQDAIREAMRLAQTPAGRQLLQMLQSSNDPQLQNAMASAAIKASPPDKVFTSRSLSVTRL